MGHDPATETKALKWQQTNICQLRQTVLFAMTVGNRHREYGETSASCEHLHGAWSVLMELEKT